MQRVEKPAEAKEPARINVRRLFLLLLVCLILPVFTGLLLDLLLETAPLFTLGTGLFCLAIATVVVLRATTLEFKRVVQEVAPELENETGGELANNEPVDDDAPAQKNR